MSKSIHRKYTWRPDVPDHRDQYFIDGAVALPPAVDLRSECPPVYDQGQLGSCTGNAIAAALAFADHKEHLGLFFTPSRLFIYYNERSMEGTVASDAGAQIRDGIKSVVKLGACAETTWPYRITKFKLKPTAKAYKEAALHQALSYKRIVSTSLSAMKSCLAAGFPFVFGFSVYESFESAEVAKTGVLNLPAVGEQMLGGHAVLCVGYDDSTERFIVRNSWGSAWGQAGYFTIPYGYLTNPNLADDFWTVRTVE